MQQHLLAGPRGRRGFLEKMLCRGVAWGGRIVLGRGPFCMPATVLIDLLIRSQKAWNVSGSRPSAERSPRALIQAGVGTPTEGSVGVWSSRGGESVVCKQAAVTSRATDEPASRPVSGTASE